jgi:dTMP kinase
VRDGFLELAAAEPERFLVIDAAQPLNAIAVQIRERVLTLL